jgi:hypothetical protein
MPGFPVDKAQRDREGGNTFALSLEEDLRLPGLFLSSFVAFAESFYSETDKTSAGEFNRHAIAHGSFNCWTEEHAVKLVMFLHLTIYIEKLLKLLLSPDPVHPLSE